MAPWQDDQAANMLSIVEHTKRCSHTEQWVLEQIWHKKLQKINLYYNINHKNFTKTIIYMCNNIEMENQSCVNESD